MFRRYAFILGTVTVALFSLLAGFMAAERTSYVSSIWGAVFTVGFLLTAVAAPILVIVGGHKLAEEDS